MKIPLIKVMVNVKYTILIIIKVLVKVYINGSKCIIKERYYTQSKEICEFSHSV